MKTIYLIVATLFIVSSGQSQNQVPMDTVLYGAERSYKKEFIHAISIFDSLIVHVVGVGIMNKRFSVFINNHNIDSTSIGVSKEIIKYGDNIIFKTSSNTEGFDSRYVAYNITNNKLTDVYFLQKSHLSDSMHIDIGRTGFYNRAYTNREIKVMRFNPFSRREEFVADFTEFSSFDIDGEGNYFTVNNSGIVDVWFINADKVFVKLGLEMNYIGDYEKFKFFLISGGKKIDITDKIIPVEYQNLENHWYQSNIQLISNDGLYFREHYWVPSEISNRIRSFEDDKIENVLFIGFFDKYNKKLWQFHNLVNGVNMQNGRIVHYFLHSNLDREENQRRIKVIIPYEFVPAFEIAKYNAFRDVNLTAKDIKGLNGHQLGILRNLIFAKHNYWFNSEFYQAYFNLFAFYNDEEKIKSRTKNINHLLTEADKANLALIRAAEARVKE